MQIELSEDDIQVLFTEFEEIDVIIDYNNCQIRRLNDGIYKLENSHGIERDRQFPNAQKLVYYLNNNAAKYHDATLLFLNGLNE
jgi:hypothetical protein